MRDKELVLEVLRQTEDAAAKIVARFQPIRRVEDFTDSPAGVEKMDAICMMLIVIGESLKNLDKIIAMLLSVLQLGQNSLVIFMSPDLLPLSNK